MHNKFSFQFLCGDFAAHFVAYKMRWKFMIISIFNLPCVAHVLDTSEWVNFHFANVTSTGKEIEINKHCNYVCLHWTCWFTSFIFFYSSIETLIKIRHPQLNVNSLLFAVYRKNAYMENYYNFILGMEKREKRNIEALAIRSLHNRLELHYLCCPWSVVLQ